MSISIIHSLVMTSKGKWVVGDTFDTNGLNNEDYKRKYQQQLQVGRRKWLEENQRPEKGDTDDTEQTTQALVKNVEEKQKKKMQYKQQLEEKEQTIQKKENEKVRDAQRFCQQLEQKEKEKAEKNEEMQRQHHLIQEEREEKEQEIQQYRHLLQEKKKEEAEKERRYHHQLQEKERELQEKERELRQSQDLVRIYQQQVSDDHWVINKDEVILTKEELGRGSYATVNVGIFRGLRVAVKSLHTIIISDYILALFSREMNIASRIRHPNLVQFIGATKVGNPLILTELMTTSLHKEIRNIRLTKQQILSIAQDVALGLNYLHLFKG